MADQPQQTIQVTTFNDGTGNVSVVTLLGGNIITNAITLAAADAAKLSAGLIATPGTTTSVQSSEQTDQPGFSNTQ